MYYAYFCYLLLQGTDYTVAFKSMDDGSSEEKILLTINTKLSGLPFVWKFFGAPATKEQVALRHIHVSNYKRTCLVADDSFELSSPF